jgi:hypothetical protein
MEGRRGGEAQGVADPKKVIWEKMGLATFWARFFNKLIWSPRLQLSLIGAWIYRFTNPSDPTKSVPDQRFSTYVWALDDLGSILQSCISAENFSDTSFHPQILDKSSNQKQQIVIYLGF